MIEHQDESSISTVSALDASCVGDGKLGQKILLRADEEFNSLVTQDAQHNTITPPVVEGVTNWYTGSSSTAAIPGWEGTDVNIFPDGVTLIDEWSSVCKLMDKRHPDNSPLPPIPPIEPPAVDLMVLDNVQVSWGDWFSVTSNISTVNKLTNNSAPLKARLCEITDQSVVGWLPSKIINTGHEEFTLLFYIHNTIQSVAKPFKKRMYMMWAPIIPGQSLLYDPRIGMFMDQIQTTSGKLIYVFIFDQENYPFIIKESVL